VPSAGSTTRIATVARDTLPCASPAWWRTRRRSSSGATTVATSTSESISLSWTSLFSASDRCEAMVEVCSWEGVARADSRQQQQALTQCSAGLFSVSRYSCVALHFVVFAFWKRNAEDFVPFFARVEHSHECRLLNFLGLPCTKDFHKPGIYVRCWKDLFSSFTTTTFSGRDLLCTILTRPPGNTRKYRVVRF
jgi:hypothetical protein